jgi:hypothetical protein
MDIRKIVTTCEDIQAELGEPTGRIVRKAVASAVIDNPLVGKRHNDLIILEAMGAEISGLLAERALAALGVDASEVTAYGKGAIVGTAGEIEHAAALIHPRFGAPVRKVVIKGDDIIPSTKKVAGPGASLTIPISNKDDIWSFNEMDSIEVCIGDAPMAHEIVVSVALAVGGRPFARTKKPS